MIIKLYPENINERQLDQAIACLKKDGVIVYPTDTVYAFGCDMNSPKAIERISRIKKMPGEIDKFSLVCSDLSHLSDYCQQISTPTFKLMKRLLPGAYTFILNANSNVPKFFRSKKKTVGIRIPDNLIARMLVEKLGNPIVSSSVIDDDEVVEYTTDPELIYERYQNEIDLLVDGGYGDNQPSTVIDCTGDEWEVIRQGKGPTDSLFNN